MLRIETTIVNLTSLAARRALGSTKEAGHKKRPQPEWICTSRMASSMVAPESA